MAEERFDVIVVGGGLAGCTAAYLLAKEGLQVLLVERGKYSGAKNVTGGIIYSRILNEVFPNFWEEAPVERAITSHHIVFLGEKGAVDLAFKTSSFGEPPYNAFSVLRANFDQWMAKKAEEAGAMVVTGVTVDDLLMENGRVKGIKSGPDELEADVVIDAEGAKSLLTRKAGLRKEEFHAGDVSIGVKEVIELPEETINERFNLRSGEGAAYTLVGYTQGLAGGGFLYTNKSSLSLGVVVKIDSLIEKGIKIHELIEDYRMHPFISRLIEGGEIVEYSAQIVHEGGIRQMPRLYTDGFLVAGSAACLVLNNFFTLRGMDLAVASGAAAAKAVLKAKEKGDFSASSLAVYETLLRESFILRDLETFKRVPDLLENRRFFTVYPELACSLLESLYYVDSTPRKKLFTLARSELKGRAGLAEVLLDLLGVVRAL
ncbi:FAD-dependent oxidoreductase [Candidatus Bathyarchaeota archaeon]|nr:MAG: FAD-dependent oxidoreductase [Candidatus Hecatellales archaeon]RLI35353.1 MAG: FAD-dependent oxidoreductase [Candidatus Bathyarchaeota archaeon]